MFNETDISLLIKNMVQIVLFLRVWKQRTSPKQTNKEQNE